MHGDPWGGKVKLVAYRLKGAAFVWWDRLKETIKRLGKNPINSWWKMQQLLRGKLLPPNYE